MTAATSRFCARFVILRIGSRGLILSWPFSIQPTLLLMMFRITTCRNRHRVLQTRLFVLASLKLQASGILTTCRLPRHQRRLCLMPYDFKSQYPWPQCTLVLGRSGHLNAKQMRSVPFPQHITASRPHPALVAHQTSCKEVLLRADLGAYLILLNGEHHSAARHALITGEKF